MAPQSIPDGELTTRPLPTFETLSVTPPTVTVTAAVLTPPRPSATRYENVSVPVNEAAGV
jgi:hypothetical protein